MEDGHNSERAVYLKHQALAILDAQKADDLRQVRKRHRKDAELAGVPLGDMDWVIKTLAMPVGEIRDFFASKIKLLGFNGVNVGQNIASKIIGDHTLDRTYEGQLAGMQGKVCSPPANLMPDEKQTWTTGWHEGHAARMAAETTAEVEAIAQAEKRAAVQPDASTAAVQELGGDDYGEEGEGEAGATATSAQEAEEDKPPHQPARRTRIKKTPEPTN